jgi:transcriptional regulator with XRE-family HTH domain
LNRDPVNALSLGRNIEAARRARKLSCRKLGLLIGVHRNTVLRWERAEVSITLYHYVAVCDALGEDPMVLMRRIPKKPPARVVPPIETRGFA